MINKDFKHNCERCERKFYSSRDDAKYCSNACRMAASRDRKAAQARAATFAAATRPAPVEMSAARWKPSEREDKWKLLVLVNGEKVYCYPLFTSDGKAMPVDGKPGYFLFFTAKGQRVALPHEQIRAAHVTQAK
jgi:hypothetical protein